MLCPGQFCLPTMIGFPPIMLWNAFQKVTYKNLQFFAQTLECLHTFMWSSWFVMLSDIYGGYGGYSFYIMAFQVKLYHVASKFASAIPEHTSEITLEGKVKDSVPHLTKVGSFSVDVSLEGSIILCRQVDQPGMIGKVGSVLGEEDINISFMSVGRTSPRQHAVMAIGVDNEPSKTVLQKLGGIAAIEEIVFLKL